MTSLDLRADCRRCAALCCVALAFDRSRLFAADKPAGEPCRHLDGGHGCAIHAQRDAQGYRGCMTFDCHGAGQFVVQSLFGGRSWRESPEVLAPMMAAFSELRAAHELAVAVTAGLGLSWPEDVSAQLETCLGILAPASPWGRADVETGRVADAVRDVRQRLAGLGMSTALYGPKQEVAK